MPTTILRTCSASCSHLRINSQRGYRQNDISLTVISRSSRWFSGKRQPVVCYSVNYETSCSNIHDISHAFGRGVLAESIPCGHSKSAVQDTSQEVLFSVHNVPYAENALSKCIAEKLDESPIWKFFRPIWRLR